MNSALKAAGLIALILGIVIGSVHLFDLVNTSDEWQQRWEEREAGYTAERDSLNNEKAKAIREIDSLETLADTLLILAAIDKTKRHESIENRTTFDELSNMPNIDDSLSVWAARYFEAERAHFSTTGD